jgi:hypothetical protein
MSLGFRYPVPLRVRRHGPRGYADYASYRPWLRDEFCFRCVYCLVREQWGRVLGEFDLDHYLPQRLHPEVRSNYDNLLYSCAPCNVAKGDQAIPDPSVVLTEENVDVEEDGAIVGLTDDAARMIRLLDLDSEDLRRWRQTWIRILELTQQVDLPLYEHLMGFPDDLPNLSRLRPPEGNSRPSGLKASYFARREHGELARTY